MQKQKPYLESMPDENGFFGRFGGAFIPPQLEEPFREIREAYDKISKSTKTANSVPTATNSKTVSALQQPTTRQLSIHKTPPPTAYPSNQNHASIQNDYINILNDFLYFKKNNRAATLTPLLLTILLFKY